MRGLQERGAGAGAEVWGGGGGEGGVCGGYSGVGFDSILFFSAGDFLEEKGLEKGLRGLRVCVALWKGVLLGIWFWFWGRLMRVAEITERSLWRSGREADEVPFL